MRALNILIRNTSISFLRIIRPLRVQQAACASTQLVQSKRLFISDSRSNQSSADAIRILPTRNIMSSSGPIYTVDYLKDKLQTGLDIEHIEIEDLSNCGCGMKFDAVIVSPQFEGKPILQRQRLVNQILTEEMKYIHALTMRTLTPAQWKDSQSKKEQGSA